MNLGVKVNERPGVLAAASNRPSRESEVHKAVQEIENSDLRHHCHVFALWDVSQSDE